ncbi:MAG TPA: hypothetical protein VGL81_32045 [Polyangiaceae bacterium]|jgi:hypothetical protein
MNHGNRLDVPSPDVIAMLAQSEVVPATNKPLGMMDVRCATVRHPTGEWFVCSAPQDAGRARLLDVAMLLRPRQDVPCLAILKPPTESDRVLELTNGYLAAYQGAAWAALGIAVILDDGKRAFEPAPVVPTPEARARFNLLVDEIHTELRADAGTAEQGTRWLLPEDSREAEALVRLTMHHVLRPRGYLRKVDGGALGKTYKGFWRGAEADGVWTSDKSDVPHLALESKLNEDVEAPLCQIVDHLAHVTAAGGGGVVCVRVHLPGRVPRERTVGMKRLEETVLVRYLDICL